MSLDCAPLTQVAGSEELHGLDHAVLLLGCCAGGS